MRKLLIGLLALALPFAAEAQLYPLFGPVTGVLKGSATTPQTTAATSGDLTTLLNPTAHGVLIGEGTSAFTSIVMGADTVLRGTASADPLATSVPNCGSGTQALSYNTTTHAFGCQTISVGGTGTVTSISAGTGITASPNPIISTGSISVDQTFSPTMTGAWIFSPTATGTNFTVNNNGTSASPTVKIASTFTSNSTNPLLGLRSSAATPFATFSISANGTVGTDDLAIFQNGASNGDASVLNRSTTGNLILGTNGTNIVTIDNTNSMTVVNKAIAASFTVTGSTVPANGLYRSATNTLAFATNTTLRGSIDANGAWSIVAPTTGDALTVPTPTGKYAIVATGNPSGIQLNNSGGSQHNYGLRSGVVATGSFDISDDTAASSRFSISSAGAVAFPAVSTTASAANAFLDNAASNNLLRSTSSARYKKDIGDLLDAERVVMHLRPVRFHSLASADSHTAWFYGLVAEEVAKIEPSLVNYDKQGRPDGVQYDRVQVWMLPLVQAMRWEVWGLMAAVALLLVWNVWLTAKVRSLSRGT